MTHDALAAWKERTKQLVRRDLGRDAARAFDAVGDPHVLGPSVEFLDTVVANYERYLTDLVTRVRAGDSSSPVAESRVPIPAFCSYSSKDDVHRARLQVALAVLEREGILKMWEFRSLEAGTDWDAEIRKHLHAAKLILLLVSPDFFASRYTIDEELTTALERHAAGLARIVPIIVRPCDWLNTDLRKLQALPQDGVAITRWPDLDAAWQDVTNGIRRVIDSMTDAEAAAPMLTTAQQKVLAVFAERGCRAGQGMPINVFIGDPAAVEAVDQLVSSDVLSYANATFIVLTGRGDEISQKQIAGNPTVLYAWHPIEGYIIFVRSSVICARLVARGGGGHMCR